MSLLEPVWDAFRGARRKPTIILLVSSPLLLVWRYYCTPEFLAETVFADLPEDGAAIAGAMGYFVGCFVLMGLVPAMIVKLVFRDRLRDYGIRLGDRRSTIRSFLCLAPVFLVAGFIASGDAGLLEKFPINPHAGRSTSVFALHSLAMFSFYLGWEFYFRGFMLHGLRESVGDANAVLIQVLASSLLHIGSPASETFGAIAGGLLWGMLALRTRSVLSGLGQHFLLGLSLDWFICFG